MNDGVNSARCRFLCPSHHFTVVIRNELLKLGYTAKKSGKSVVVSNVNKAELDNSMMALGYSIGQELNR